MKFVHSIIVKRAFPAKVYLVFWDKSRMIPWALRGSKKACTTDMDTKWSGRYV